MEAILPVIADIAWAMCALLALIGAIRLVTGKHSSGTVIPRVALFCVLLGVALTLMSHILHHMA